MTFKIHNVKNIRQNIKKRVFISFSRPVFTNITLLMMQMSTSKCTYFFHQFHNQVTFLIPNVKKIRQNVGKRVIISFSRPVFTNIALLMMQMLTPSCIFSTRCTCKTCRTGERVNGRCLLAADPKKYKHSRLS